MFWNRKKVTYNEYELEYTKQENVLMVMGSYVRKLVAEIRIKNEACKMYSTDSNEYKITNNEILEKKKQLLKAMGEYTTQWKHVVTLLTTTKEHFVTLDKNRKAPPTARQQVEIAIRYGKGK